jgi:hypothetical protein
MRIAELKQRGWYEGSRPPLKWAKVRLYYHLLPRLLASRKRAFVPTIGLRAGCETALGPDPGQTVNLLALRLRWFACIGNGPRCVSGRGKLTH